MKIVLSLLAIIGLIYYVISYHSPFQTVVTDPYYVEIRLDMDQSDVQLVGFGKMNSYEDCQTRAFLVWANNLKSLGEVEVDTKCSKDLPGKYKKLFDGKAANASYIAFDKGSDAERDARFLIYGVPSSYVYKQCEKITQKVKQTYSGNIYCIQGKVG